MATEAWRSSDWINYLLVYTQCAAKGYRTSLICFDFRHLPKFGGYDQFGALLGQVFIEKDNCDEMELIEINLPGLRQRRFMANDNRLLRRSVSFIGVCKDGSVYVIGAESFAKHMTQYLYSVFVKLKNFEIS